MGRRWSWPVPEDGFTRGIAAAGSPHHAFVVGGGSPHHAFGIVGAPDDALVIGAHAVDRPRFPTIRAAAGRSPDGVPRLPAPFDEIGRASCRERAIISA